MKVTFSLKMRAKLANPNCGKGLNQLCIGRAVTLLRSFMQGDSLALPWWTLHHTFHFHARHFHICVMMMIFFLSLSVHNKLAFLYLTNLYYEQFESPWEKVFVFVWEASLVPAAPLSLASIEWAGAEPRITHSTHSTRTLPTLPGHYPQYPQ